MIHKQDTLRGKNICYLLSLFYKAKLPPQGDLFLFNLLCQLSTL